MCNRPLIAHINDCTPKTHIDEKIDLSALCAIANLSSGQQDGACSWAGHAFPRGSFGNDGAALEPFPVGAVDRRL